MTANDDDLVSDEVFILCNEIVQDATTKIANKLNLYIRQKKLDIDCIPTYMVILFSMMISDFFANCEKDFKSYQAFQIFKQWFFDEIVKVSASLKRQESHLRIVQ
jgi:hypothetical protein